MSKIIIYSTVRYYLFLNLIVIGIVWTSDWSGSTLLSNSVVTFKCISVNLIPSFSNSLILGIVTELLDESYETSSITPPLSFNNSHLTILYPYSASKFTLICSFKSVVVKISS